jgi:hypothetical protein
MPVAFAVILAALLAPGYAAARAIVRSVLARALGA